MSQPTPISRSMMQNLKAAKDEEICYIRLNNLVKQIYKVAVDCATNGHTTSYNHAIPFASAQNSEKILPKSSLSYPAPYKRCADPFYIEYMPAILAMLKDVFPGCDVSHSIMAKGTDGKLYDVSKLDDKVLPFVNTTLDQSYIVIDWS
jgi:hypothetical protein